MLFPENPKQRPQLWDALADQLEKRTVVVVISGGKGDLSAASRHLSPDEAEALMSRMRDASISRISASRGTAIAPHFCGSVYKKTAFITDFITNSAKGSRGVEIIQLQKDLEVAVLSLLYGADAFDFVRAPIHIPSWISKDVLIRTVADGVEFQRVS